jgi:hypothetical protein
VPVRACRQSHVENVVGETSHAPVPSSRRTRDHQGSRPSSLK